MVCERPVSGKGLRYKKLLLWSFYFCQRAWKVGIAPVGCGSVLSYFLWLYLWYSEKGCIFQERITSWISIIKWILLTIKLIEEKTCLCHREKKNFRDSISNYRDTFSRIWSIHCSLLKVCTDTQKVSHSFIYCHVLYSQRNKFSVRVELVNVCRCDQHSINNTDRMTKLGWSASYRIVPVPRLFCNE